jgi:predicted PurR-regulated permease PerM
MSELKINSDRFRAAFVIVLVVAISLLFLAMIWSFLKALLLAAIVAGMLRPVYRRIRASFRGRETAAALTTIFLVIFLVLGPLTAFLGVVASQASQISETLIPWIKNNVGSESYTEVKAWLLEEAPAVVDVLPDRDQLLEGVAGLARSAGNFLMSSASSVTAGTAAFFLNLFIMLYALYFFLVDGKRILERILYYTPLAHEDDERMIERFASITRATIKGTVVIALIQGLLGGIALYVAGIGGAAFWGTIMVVLSVIPGIGATLVWLPAVIYLLVTGDTLAGALLGAWCAGVVGSIDNVLRPILVGRDAKMPDLLILLGTLGGIFLFGTVGFIIGPIVCGLFLTVWEIYGVTFKDSLPPVLPLDRDDAAPPSTDSDGAEGSAKDRSEGEMRAESAEVRAVGGATETPDGASSDGAQIP